MTDFYEIEQLVKLFNPQRDNDDSDGDYTNDDGEIITNERNPEKSKETKVNPYAKIDQPERIEKDIDCYTDDNLVLNENQPSSDWKETPTWNISYRQQVTASDVFLQMGAKTPATASCEDMIVTIDLPGEHMQNMDIKVHKDNLDVISPNFALKIPLPQPVQPQKGDAKWDKDQEKLIVTLRMEREFDFVNF